LTEHNELVQIPEAADELGVSPQTVRKEIRDGRIVSVKVRDRRLIPRPDLDAYKEALRAASLAELVVSSRAAQGLPPTVTDPDVLKRVAAVLES
jgi:excisionase family DNA binding protein